MKDKHYAPMSCHDDCSSYPLTYQQERVLYLSKLDEDNTLWNKTSCQWLQMDLHINLLERAVGKLIARHDILRSRIILDHGEPVQVMDDACEGYYTYTDRTMMTEGSKLDVQQLVDEYHHIPMDVMGKRLFAVKVIRLDTQEYCIMLKLHHIISDATSFKILWRDLIEIYNALEGGRDANLTQLSIKYGDFSRWQKENMTIETLTKEKDYWLNMYKEKLSVQHLPYDSYKLTNSFRGATVTKRMDKSLMKAITTLSLKNKVVAYSTYLAAFYILLYKYTGINDRIITTVINGRHYSNYLRDMVGFFVNTVGIRHQYQEALTVTDILKQVHKKVTEAYAMQDYPFHHIVDDIKAQRDISVTDVMFNMVNYYPEKEFFVGTIHKEDIIPTINKTQTHLLLDIHQYTDYVDIHMEYNTDMFDEVTVNKMLNQYVMLIHHILADPSIRMKDIPIMSKGHKQVLEQRHGNTRNYDKSSCIHQLFAEQVKLHGNGIAVRDEESEISYSELEIRSNALAHELKKHHVKDKAIVGVMSKKSVDYIIAILGIMKAGAAYLPINPALPEERIKYMLDHAGVKVVIDLTTEKTSPYNDYVCISDIKNLQNTYVPKVHMESCDPAYVIYTSGSTGKPKGVSVSHQALHNFVLSLCDRYRGAIGSEDCCLSLSNISFDVSVAEIFFPLLNGATLYLYESEKVIDIDYLVKTIIDQNISFTYLPPFLLQDIADAFMPLKHLLKLNKLLVGVEPILGSTLRRYKELNHKMMIINGYGPTEATICTTMYRYTGEEEDEKIVPIGYPVNNTQVYILDENCKETPIGIPGELCISGDALALGYVNDSQGTKERFIGHPFEDGRLMYKTGDMVKYLDDGSIQFLGRKDEQLKIRGYRIELGEIKNVLLGIKGIREAVVTVMDRDNKQLVAYVVMDEQIDLTTDCMKKALSTWLPNYMIPAHMMILDQLPLTENGKVDRHALPEPVLAAKESMTLSPLQEKLISITENLLNIEGVNIHDNFFNIGGNSLLTIRFVSEIEEAFNIQLSLMSLVDLPVLDEIAKNIESVLDEAAPTKE